MQLTQEPASSLRGRLSTAACMLLASALPAMAQSDGSATTRFEATGLLYGENQRAKVVEPTARVTHWFVGGASLSGQIGIDVITGASPTGAMPSGRTQTITSASGQVSTVAGDQLPTTTFNDTRVALDGEWTQPAGRFSSTLGGHFSREKDYQSLGANARVSLEFMHRLTTLTLGGGYNHDSVFPQGGITAGLGPVPVRTSEEDDEGGGTGTPSSSKQVANGLVGLSRVLTRRWLVGVNAARTIETGYLTEPYKVVSLVDGTTGYTTGELTEKRPDRRQRSSLLASSVYHLSEDVLYVSYRYYWDDWQVHSHTADVKYRHELSSGNWLEPHLRYYAQTAASFFGYGLVDGAPLPEFASSDYRLGGLSTVTVGATYGFRLASAPGEWTVRAEYLAQFGDGHPQEAIGVQRSFDLFPTLSIGSLVAGYSIAF